MKKSPLFRHIVSLVSLLFCVIGTTRADNAQPIRYENPTQQVIGGEDADIMDMAFLGALVWNEDGDNSRQFCTCTAIDPYWVLTAAHCLDGITFLKDFKVVFGTADLANFDAGLVFHPKTLILNPNHSELYDDKFGDVALVQLSTPLPDWIVPVRLNELEALELPGNKAVIAGWGRTSLDQTSASDILQSAEVTLHDLETVQLSDYTRSRVQGTLLPAGEVDPYRSTYSGDSGGPLMVHNSESGSWTQLGITSFSLGNKAENPIAFFTRVSSYKDWIQDIVENDFHHWLGKWKIQTLFDHDSDGYQPALEWMLGQNPFEADPDWSRYLIPNHSTESPAIVLPLKIRDFSPRLFLNLQTSTDLKLWETTNFPYFDWASTPTGEKDLSVFEVPVVSQSTPGTFHRLQLKETRGLYHGPLPLRLGKHVFGSLGKAYNDTGLNPNGLIYYDFLLDTFGFDDPVDIYLTMFGGTRYNLTIYNMDTGIVHKEYPSAGSDFTSKFELVPHGGHNFLVRVERIAGQSQVQSPFYIYADFQAQEQVHSPGEIISGRLTPDDQPYVRPGYYADRYKYDLPTDQMYKITLSSDTLDPVIITKFFDGRVSIEEVDEEPPGVAEEFLVYSRTESLLEFLAGSWRFEETGDYNFSVTEYTEPGEVRPGDDFLGMIDINDRRSAQSNFVSRFDYYRLANFDVTKGMSLVVDGLEDHSLSYVIFDNTEGKIVHQTSTSQSLIGYFLQTIEGHEYDLIIVSREEFLGKNFRIKGYDGNIFITPDVDEESDEEEPTTEQISHFVFDPFDETQIHP